MAEGLYRPALDALGDANRRAILEILSAGAQSVQEIADRLPISRPAVSRHLRVLKEAGLVGDEPDGTRRVYQLRDEGIEAVREYFRSVWGEAAARFRLTVENTGERSLRSEPSNSALPPRNEVAGSPSPSLRGDGSERSLRSEPSNSAPTPRDERACPGDRQHRACEVMA